MAYVNLPKTRQILAAIELPLVIMPLQTFKWVNIKLIDIMIDLAGSMFVSGIYLDWIDGGLDSRLMNDWSQMFATCCLEIFRVKELWFVVLLRFDHKSLALQHYSRVTMSKHPARLGLIWWSRLGPQLQRCIKFVWTNPAQGHF